MCYATIARVLGLQNFNIITTVRALVNWTQFMMKEMDMDLSMSDTGKCTKEEYEGADPGHGRGRIQKDSCTDNPRTPPKKWSNSIGICGKQPVKTPIAHDAQPGFRRPEARRTVRQPKRVGRIALKSGGDSPP